MKKLIIPLIISFLAVSLVYAVSIDLECQEFGFDYGVSKWQCEDDENPNWFIDEEVIAGTTVSGTCEEANWNVGTSGATGIVVKAGSTVHYSETGTSGTIYETQPSTSHVVFCGKRDKEVPEFGTIGAVLALAGAGLYLYKKRK